MESMVARATDRAADIQMKLTFQGVQEDVAHQLSIETVMAEMTRHGPEDTEAAKGYTMHEEIELLRSLTQASPSHGSPPTSPPEVTRHSPKDSSEAAKGQDGMDAVMQRCLATGTAGSRVKLV